MSIFLTHMDMGMETETETRYIYVGNHDIGGNWKGLYTSFHSCTVEKRMNDDGSSQFVRLLRLVVLVSLSHSHEVWDNIGMECVCVCVKSMNRK